MGRTQYLLGCAAAVAMTLSMGVSSAFADTFALVTINQQALFFNQINDGANAAAKAAGVDLVIFNANNVPSAQNDAIENYITQKVDGIILVAIDVNGVKPAITQFQKVMLGHRDRGVTQPVGQDGLVEHVGVEAFGAIGLVVIVHGEMKIEVHEAFPFSGNGDPFRRRGCACGCCWFRV